MKASLVSHYGKKHASLSAYLSALQEILSSSLGCAFAPYAIEQIHATIIGFESAGVKNSGEGFEQWEGQVDPAKILNYLRSPDLPSFDIQIGGYLQSRDYGFLSQQKHPSLRSFSIQNDTAVAMGWPVGGTNILDVFRRSFNRFNIRHKWHQTDEDIDNDFYFVIGKIKCQSVDDRLIAPLQQKIRDFMNNSPPLKLHVGAETIVIAGYSNRELPCSSTVAHKLADSTFTPTDFLDYLIDRESDNLV